jgi:hypothetical protein
MSPGGILTDLGRLAQMVRAPPSHGGGRGFKSLIAHFEKPQVTRLLDGAERGDL